MGKQLEDKLSALQQPNGKSRDKPARSCLDLYLGALAKKTTIDSGMYWVDPNSEHEADAIEVKCDFDSYESIETCVYPTHGFVTVDSHVRSHTGDHQWWSAMDFGMPISYDPAYEQRVDRADYASQITFLRLLSSQVRQKVEYSCAGGIADI